MKYAFISDIHGNAVALEAVLQDIERNKVDKIIVLGDLCFRGPEPKKSLDLIRSLNTDVIKGNADEWVVRGVQQGEVPDQNLPIMNKEREWTVSQLESADLDYLVKLPQSLTFQAEDQTIKVFHATPDSLFEIVRPNTDNEIIFEKMMNSDEQIFVYAHIHTPFIRYIKGKVIINIGSVGLPFDGLQKASYGIVEVDSGKIRTSIERVDFDVEKVMDLYETVHYPNTETMVSILRNAGI